VNSRTLIVQIAGESAAGRTALPDPSSLPSLVSYNISVTRAGTPLGGCSGVSANTASGNGGGVYVVDTGGMFTLSGGSVSGNTASVGGGVYLEGGSFAMNGGTISGNEAADPANGGGVFIAGGGFTVADGTISGNTASVGGGVFITSAGSFAMEDSAFISQDNEVWLAGGKKIEITADLTGTPPVARITPQVYAAGTGVLDGSIIASNHDKFTVTPQDNGTEWEINDEGKLLQSP
jgi:parallel beta-helix repeat protein